MINLLYVEDDPGSRMVIKMAQRINPEPFNLVIFEDSCDFEQRLLSLGPQPDVIMLDIHVKPLTGFKMLDIIRSHAAFDKTRVVALTASVMNEEVELLHTAGFQGAISKPLNLDEFPNMIHRILRGEALWHVW